MNSENNANKNNNISDNSTTNMNIEDDVTNEAIDIFNRKVDSNVSKLYDSYATILKLAQVDSSLYGYEQPQIVSSCTNIVHCCQNLLQQIHELKVAYIVNAKDEDLQNLNENEV